MILQLQFPNIDPVFLRIGPVQLRWYGLMYMISFIAGYFLLKRLVKMKKLAMTTDDLYDLLFFLILGVMVGGRLGYVLFYDLGSYIQRPIEMLYIWQGGMSFHGGFVGMVLATLFLCWKRKWSFWACRRLCVRRSADWTGPGPNREFHQRRTLRQADHSSLGNDFSSRGRCRAAPVANLRSAAGRRGPFSNCPVVVPEEPLPRNGDVGLDWILWSVSISGGVRSRARRTYRLRSGTVHARPTAHSADAGSRPRDDDYLRSTTSPREIASSE